jgi:plasmid stability protein
MRRVQVQFTDDQVRTLRERASDSGRPIAAVVRDAVDAWIASDAQRRRSELALAAIGGFRSGLGDLAEHHDRYIDEATR